MVMNDSDLTDCTHMADELIKLADTAQRFPEQCKELKVKGEKMRELLMLATRKCGELYERPAQRIIDDTKKVLEKALQLVEKNYVNRLMKRIMFSTSSAEDFRKINSQLDNAITNVHWLILISTTIDDIGVGMPPIASDEPMLFLVWEHIATLLMKSSKDKRSATVAGLLSLARDDNKRNNKMIIEEGGVPPLMKVLKEGDVEDQENAAKAIHLLAKEADDVQKILNEGVCTVFAKILKEGDMKVQAAVALAIADFATIDPKCQEFFVQTNCIRLLVRHLAFETIQEHSKYIVNTKHNMSSIHSLVMASNAQSDPNNINMHEDGHHIHHDDHYINNDDDQHHPRPLESQSSSSQIHNVITNTMAAKQQQAQGKHIFAGAASLKAREAVDPAIKAEMKANAAEALWRLSVKNVAVCKSITESKALLCFAVLLEKRHDENVRYNSAYAIKEITAVAEENAELRHSAFKPNTTAARALLDQFVRILDDKEESLIQPCVVSIGNLARTFKKTETRFIPRLVSILDQEITQGLKYEVINALIKFAVKENFLHEAHCTSIIEAGGDQHLIQIVNFDENELRVPALFLLCTVVVHFPNPAELAQNIGLLSTLGSIGGNQELFVKEDILDLWCKAQEKVEIYRSVATET